MSKAQAKQLVVCVKNEGYSASLEKRKLYVALRDQAAEKHGLIRIVDEIRRRLPLSKTILPLDRAAAGRQESSISRCLSGRSTNA